MHVPGILQRLYRALPRSTRRARGRLLITSGVAVTAVVLLAAGSAPASGLARAVATSRATGGAAPRLTGPPLTTDTNATCNAPPKKGYVRCLAVVRTPSNHDLAAAATPGQPPSTALGPAAIQSAYKLPSAGSGQTVAIVDALGDAQAESDLATFRSYYGLPPCTTADGCFKKVDQTGGTSYPADDSGWALETSLDLDAVSSACPTCNILLVEGNSASLGDLTAAENEAVALGAKYISNSYGATEDPSELAFDSAYSHPGVAITASTGDTGNVIIWPSSNPSVTAVGGTTLTTDTSVPRGWAEKAWSSGGSGCSAIEPRPDYQNGVTTDCAMRATADIAADADPASGLATYDTLGQGGWLQVGGTSLASPLMAAMYALAGAPAADTYPVDYPYHDPTQSSDLFDVTSGSDGSCGNLLCNAGPGWDGPTGLGTPDGVKALAGGPQGQISGQVTDQTTGKPVTDATVTANPGNYVTHTDAAGDYTLDVAAGSYTVTAAMYAYQTASQAGVSVTAAQSTSASFSLAVLPHATVSGTVTDGSGHGWPLYAQITIDGYPGGPVYTDPFTGRYSVVLAGPATYTVHITAAYPPVFQAPGHGYLQKDTQLTVGTGGVTSDFSLAADMKACSAPGYGWAGLSEDFTGWPAARPQDGWTITGSGWRFDNPGNRSAPSLTGGDDAFAVADAGYAGGRLDSTLTSPLVSLAGQPAPRLSFDSGYYAAGRQSAAVDLSTDGGRTWTTIWHAAASDAVGPVDVPVPQAANRPDVRVRFHYRGTEGWWWAVDDVLLGTRSCVALPGGMLAGLITDQATGQPLNAVTVTSEASQGVSGISASTADPNLPGGLYWLFTPFTGSQEFTAAAAGYTSSPATVTVAGDQITRRDWALTATGSG
jgi:hypothetical protein